MKRSMKKSPKVVSLINQKQNKNKAKNKAKTRLTNEGKKVKEKQSITSIPSTFMRNKVEKKDQRNNWS